MRKRILCIMLTICMALMLVPTAVFAEGGVQYRYCDENGKNWQTGTKTEYTVVSSEDYTWGDDGNDGWYVATGNVTIESRVTVSGNVHLILTDGCKLTVNGGIKVQDDDNDPETTSPNALTIYAQSDPVLNADGTVNETNNKAGKLTAKNGSSAIGGDGANSSNINGQSCGIVTINGGIVEAISDTSAGIGGGNGIADKNGAGGSGGIITINGGNVIASGDLGAGIGGGMGPIGADGGIITINGGTVKAGSNGGSGIGGGYCGGGKSAGAEITINGGNVTATSNNSVGIGGNKPGSFSTGNNGNAVIFAKSIAYKDNQSNWSGIIFEGNNDGIVYGTSVTPTDNFTIPTGKTLTIGENQTITIPEGKTLTNEGTIDNSGKIFVDGTFTGTADNLYYPLTLENATAAGDASVYNTKTYGKAGSEITLTPDTPTGYELKQWNSVPAVTISENKFTMPSAAVKINALFDLRTYIVAFVLNGGTINSGNITGYTYGQGATLPTDVTKAGYTFKGWYDNESLTGSPVTAISETETGEKKYWAKWEAKTFNVALNTNGGTINSGEIDKYIYGQGAALPTDVTKTGYSFKGWYDNQALTGSPVTAISETEAEDKEYWAKWEAKTFNVSLNTNGGTINSGNITGYTYGQGAALPTDVTKAGYTFKGWYDNESLTGSPVTAISETEAEDKEYWAKWEEKTYTVKFNTNGGNFINDKTVKWTDKVLDRVFAPTKNGWEFTGWTYGNTAVTAGATYSSLAENDSVAEITLIAQWKKAAIPTGGGSVSSNQHTCKDVSPKDHKCDTCGATLSNHSGGTATCTEKAICEICGKPYGETESSNHSLEKIPAKDATVTKTGNKEYWHCEDCDKNFSDKNGKNEIEPEDMIIPKLSPEIIEGAGQSVTKGERKALTFRSNAEYDDFIRVELDGKTLDEKNYTVKEGSTVVTLKADFVATLSVGRHTLAIVSESGTATAEFTVYATAEEAEEAEEIEEIEEIEDDDICPPTGYENMPLLTLMLVSGGTALISGKRKQSKNR